MHKFLLLNNEEVAKYGVGRMISVLQKGVDAWAESLDGIYRNVSWIVVGYCMGLCYIGFLSIQLLFIALACTILIGICIHFLNKKALYWRKFRRSSEDAIVRQIVIMIMEKFTILKSNMLEGEIKKLNALHNQHKEYAIKTDYYIEPLGFLPEFLIQLLKLAMIILVGWQIGEGTSTLGDITAVVLVTGILSTYIASGAQEYKKFTDKLLRIEQLWSTFDTIPSIHGYIEGEDFQYISGAIELSGIHYGYSQKQFVFEDFSLSLRSGEKLAIVGRSGVGKSTLIKLILGFVQPQKGSILVDGQNLGELSLASYYRYVGYLSQDPGVFDGTIRENITYGILDSSILTPEKIHQAILSAECDFIYSLPQGLETEIGEKGVRLSGGERQRLAIARLFLQEPHIIILDEPTSALDSYSEAKIAQALHMLSKEKTIITIAHRLQTVKNADTIIVLGKNTILERGTHVELLAKNGIYSGMVDLQNGRIRED